MRPTIYIGLGGTGIRAIAQAKKEFEDVYGVGMVPPCIAFLAVDSDSSILEDKTLATSVEDNFVEGLEPQAIAERIDRCWQQVLAIIGLENNIVDFHIVSSLADGAGSLITVADIIKHGYNVRANILGYGVLHGVFRAMKYNAPRVAANAYSAVLDLDYTMSASYDNPVKFEINGIERGLTSPLFNEFFVVDNQTERGHILTNINEICEVLGLCLFANGGDMAGRVHTALDRIPWKYGEFNVNNKIGWVHSLGACKVVYKGEQLAQLYGYKAAIELIRKMCQEGLEAPLLAQQWVEKVGVREEQYQYSMLIDSIVEPMTIERLRILQLCITNNIDEIKSDVANYIGDMSDMPSDACIKKMLEEKKESLVAKVKQLLSQENGVGNSHIFLDSLIRLCDKYRCEKVDEIGQLNIALEKRSSILEKIILEYQEYCSKPRLFQSRTVKQEYLDEISRRARSVRQINYEIKRREIARDIFICLIKEAGELSCKIDALDWQLQSLCADYTQSIERLQNAENSMFEHDLSVDERMNMTLKNDFSIAELVNSLPVSLLDLDIEKQLRSVIEQYVATLPQAVKYREQNITDVIEALSNEDYDRVKEYIDVKSSRLLRVDNHGLMCSRTGQTPSEKMYSGIFYSIYSPKGNEQVREQTRLERDEAGYFGRCFTEFVLTNAESSRQQITVLRVDGAIIPYCIEALDKAVVAEYEKAVQEGAWNPHFDKGIYEQMKAQSFSLKPEC